MRQLGLRSRLLLAVGLVALVQIIAAGVVISVTSDQLLDQIDDRLAAAAADPLLSVNGTAQQGDRVGDVYRGLLTSDGAMITLVAVTDRGKVVPPPAVGPGSVDVASQRPITVEAQRGQVEYRVLAVESGDDTLVLASPLDGYEWTMNRLTGLVTTTATIVALVLGAVTWWVLRLGVRPIKQMTTAAEAIAAGDLAERVNHTHPGTEAGQLGLALNTMMGRIENSFEERARAEMRLRQFIADASHELRTPVATIRAYAELYQAGGLDDRVELDDAMRRTSEESERMSRLISDMLNLAKLDRSPSLRTEPVELVALARDVVADAIASHGDRTIRTDVAAEPVVVEGDKDLLRQAVANLVSNALVHTEPDATTTVSIHSDGVRAVVTVADDGEGMPDDVARRATERFFRADPSRSRHKGGSGLGLAIVVSIVEAHSGELLIESSPGVGTTVTLTLPLDDQFCGSQQIHS